MSAFKNEVLLIFVDIEICRYLNFIYLGIVAVTEEGECKVLSWTTAVSLALHQLEGEKK